MTESEPTTPICVDLDGTLIRTDILQESLYQFIRSNPLHFFLVLFWFFKGRAYLKQEVAKRVSLDLSQLPVNEEFYAYLKEMRERGSPLYLVTASDQAIARPIADYFGIFTDTFASDGKTNLRSSAKADFLAQKFGKGGFLYAGNSRHDLSVWAKSRFAIAVNTPQYLIQSLYESGIKVMVFVENHYVFGGIIKLLSPRQWMKNFIFTVPLFILGLADKFVLLDYFWAVMSYCLVDIWASTCGSLIRFKQERTLYSSKDQAKRSVASVNPLVTGQIYIATAFQFLCFSTALLIILYSVLDTPYDAFIFIYGGASIILAAINPQKRDLHKFKIFTLSTIIFCSTLYYLFS
ncbi:MAG: haloacid dehalogenase-like hydrolase [Candidatus Nucleicultricaceae bacterium]